MRDDVHRQVQEADRHLHTLILSGIGLESAILFASEGAHVVCADIRAEAVEKTLGLINEIVADAPKCIAVTCDVGKESDIKSMVDKAVAEFGRLDVIFNNAGISG